MSRKNITPRLKEAGILFHLSEVKGPESFGAVDTGLTTVEPEERHIHISR
jgi:hypothetical protein